MTPDKTFHNQDPACDSSRHSPSPECWASRSLAKSGSPAAEVNNIQLETMSHEDEFPDFAIRY